MDVLKFAEWALKNGATGVLVLVVAGLVYALRQKDREVREAYAKLEAEKDKRVNDLKMASDIVGKHAEKNFKLAGDLSRVVDFIDRERRRSNR